MILYYLIKEVKCLLNKWRHSAVKNREKKRNRFSVHFAKRGYRSYEGHSLSFSPDILVPNILTPITLIFGLLGDSSICIIFEKVEAEIYFFSFMELPNSIKVLLPGN